MRLGMEIVGFPHPRSFSPDGAREEDLSYCGFDFSRTSLLVPAVVGQVSLPKFRDGRVVLL